MKKLIALSAFVLLIWSACTQTPQLKGPVALSTAAFDTVLNGDSVTLYTLTNDSGMMVQLTNYGARIVALWVPDAAGEFKDVVLGYESIAEYLSSTDHFCGPIVGRYGNRINKGTFTLDDKTYHLTINDGENHLHGGVHGFWDKVWKAHPVNNSTVAMSYMSAAGEEGYPGNLAITVTYTLTQDNALKIEYQATTDSATILNPTSHSYFNLHGTTAGSTNTHLLTLNADWFTPTDAGLIPTGELDSVAGTPMDFRQPTLIGERIDADFEPMKLAKGYDHNWVLNKTGKELSFAAEVYEPSTGIVMRIETDQPAIQFYSGNFMDGSQIGKRGEPHNYRTGIALETQNYPDAPNHENFPSAVLRPGETYTQTCIYAFSVRK